MKYKGYELLKAIADGEIKEGSRFIFKTNQDIENVYWNGENFKYVDSKGNVMLDYADIELINGTFELIEDEIDSIEEIYEAENDYVSDDILEFFNEDRSAINTLIQAVKQLNKEIKELKEEK